MKKYFMSLLVAGMVANASAQTLPNLPIPMGAGTAEVWNDSIYYLGGSNDWSGSILYPRIYKFGGSTWSYHDSIPDNNVWDVESVLIGDEIFLVSGWPSGSTFLRKYNLTSRNWTDLAPSPNAQTWGVTAEYLNGNIYLFNSTGAVYVYNLAGNTWTARTSNPTTGPWDLSSVLYQNEIYMIGFYNQDFYKYTPVTDQWTQLADAPYQVGACATGIINDLIYCVGGNSGGGAGATYRSVIVYDISTNSWAIDSLEIPEKRHWMATAEYRGGLYVLGGIDSLAQAVDIVEEIVPQGTAGVLPEEQIPGQYSLSQNYPNPFNPSTVIRFQLPVSSFVTLKVYNLLGQEEATLVNEELRPGNYRVNFDAAGLATGVYFYRLQAGTYTETKKLLLLR